MIVDVVLDQELVERVKLSLERSKNLRNPSSLDYAGSGGAQS